MIALDRLGQMIEAGQLVLHKDIVFEVMAVTPLLNVQLPPGQRGVSVMLTTQFPIQQLAAVPNMALCIVGETAALKASRAGNNGQPAEPPSDEQGSGIVLTDQEQADSQALQDALQPDAEPDGKTDPPKDID